MDHSELFEEMGDFAAFLPPYAITVAIPLIDLNEETGTTAIWPGSHRSHANVPEEENEMTFKHAILPEAKAGDCVMWDFRTYHC